MAVPHANRPRPATLVVAVVVGLALAGLLHRAVPVAAPGPLGELQHVAVAPLLSLLALLGWTRVAPSTRARVPGGRALLAVVLLAAAGHEALETAHELLAHSAGGTLEHLTHALPPALGLLLPALAAAAGLTRILVLAVTRPAAPDAVLGRVPLAPRPRQAAAAGVLPQLLRAGRSAGRAPPRSRTA